jgi:hypothetical protein
MGRSWIVILKGDTYGMGVEVETFPLNGNCLIGVMPQDLSMTSQTCTTTFPTLQTWHVHILCSFDT